MQNRYQPKWLIITLFLLLILARQAFVQAQKSDDYNRSYVPLVTTNLPSCEIPGQTYHALNVTGSSSNPDAEDNPDLNLGLRGYELTTASLELVEIGPLVDSKAPQFPALFSNNRVPVFSNAYHRYRWDWDCHCPTDTYSPWDTTLLGMAVAPGEIIQVPDSGYDIGGGYEVMVLYADEERITFHVGNSDKLDGYVMHLEDVCTEPDLLALYESLHANGRRRLPVLRGHQPFGRALGNEIKIAVRDSGHFLDPRSRNNWWQGR